MHLPDYELVERVGREAIITPAPRPGDYQPASIDIRLGCIFRLPRRPARWRRLVYAISGRGMPAVDLVCDDLPALWSAPIRRLPLEEFTLAPGAVCLAETAERFAVPRDLVLRLEGKSTLGRMFVSIHQTAGFVDPGFAGTLTLEIHNGSPWPVVLRPGMLIGQVSLARLTGVAQRPYGRPGLGSHYQHQRDAAPARGGFA